MPARSLNLGILAHVDAGKTTLTERLLHLAGVIDEPGSVDSGTTQTDALALERRRGITIKAAVVAFPVGDTTVNVVDTPGHPDFIAEVERVLAVLDGAVLVLSAVEGVQPQTRILMRALQRLHVPTLLFINKIDRMGADPRAVLAAVRTRLTSDVLAMGSVTDPGSRAARFRAYDGHDAAFCDRVAAALAEHDDRLLAGYVEGRLGSARQGRAALLEQTRAGVMHPVFAGSAVTGAGVLDLMRGIQTLLPDATGSRTLRRRVGYSRSSAEPAGRRLPTSGWSTARYALGNGSTCRRAGSGRCRVSRCSRQVGGSAPVAWRRGRSAGCTGSPRSESATPSVCRAASRSTSSPRPPLRRR